MNRSDTTKTSTQAPAQTLLHGAPAGYDRSFVGRHAELAEILDGQQSGVVALWGPPGVGKTQLGIEVARRLLVGGEFERGAFCALQAANDGDDVIAALGRALDFPIRSGGFEQAVEVLTHWISSRRVLLVLDNAEGLLGPILKVANRLAAASPQSMILVTTRHRPDDENTGSIQVEPLSTVDGVELLRARAENLYEVDEQVLQALVTGLDGLPLTIELAAGRLPVYSCRQLLERLDDQLETLQDYDDHEQRWRATLTRSLDASWTLLSVDERAALKQCSIFHDAFCLDAAETVLKLPKSSPVDQIIHGLIRKSLLYPVARTEDTQQRFRLYESIREYAAQKVDATTRESLTRRLVAYFSGCVEEHSQGFYSPQFRIHLEAMGAEFTNAYLALVNVAGSPPKYAARLARGISQFVLITAPYRDLRALLAKTLEDLEGIDAPAAKAEILIVLAEFETVRSRKDQALDCLKKAAAIAEAHDLVALLAEAKTFLGYLEIHYQNLDQAERYLREAENILRGQELDRLSGALQNDLGSLCMQRGNPDQARVHFRQALMLHRRCDNPRFESQTLSNLAAVECARGRFEQALSFHQEVNQIWNNWGDKFHLAGSTADIGQILLALGRIEEAIEALEIAKASFEEIGERMFLAAASSWLGLALARAGQPGAASLRSDEAIGIVELLGARAPQITFLAHRVVIESANKASQAARKYLQKACDISQPKDTGLHRGALDVARQFTATINNPTARVDSLQSDAMAQHEIILFAAVADAILDAGLDMPDIAHGEPALIVAAPTVDWFQWDDELIDLSRRDAPRKILSCLVENRVNHSGEAVCKDELVTRGWPDEVLHPEAATGRLYTAIRQLRELGLRDILLTRSGGYLLDPKVPLIRSQFESGPVSTV